MPFRAARYEPGGSCGRKTPSADHAASPCPAPAAPQAQQAEWLAAAVSSLQAADASLQAFPAGKGGSEVAAVSEAGAVAPRLASLQSQVQSLSLEQQYLARHVEAVTETQVHHELALRATQAATTAACADAAAPLHARLHDAEARAAAAEARAAAAEARAEAAQAALATQAVALAALATRLDAQEASVELRVLYDHSAVEAFTTERGAAPGLALATRHYGGPRDQCGALRVVAIGGDAAVMSATAWAMGSIWDAAAEAAPAQHAH